MKDKKVTLDENTASVGILDSTYFNREKKWCHYNLSNPDLSHLNKSDTSGDMLCTTLKALAMSIYRYCILLRINHVLGMHYHRNFNNLSGMAPDK